MRMSWAEIREPACGDSHPRVTEGRLEVAGVPGVALGPKVATPETSKSLTSTGSWNRQSHDLVAPGRGARASTEQRVPSQTRVRRLRFVWPRTQSPETVETPPYANDGRVFPTLVVAESVLEGSIGHVCTEKAGTGGVDVIKLHGLTVS